MLSIIATLCRWLDQPEQRRLRREFALWVQRVLLRRKPFAERSILQGEEIQDLEEVQQMLAERMNEWKKEWEQRGLKKGRQEGRQEGRLEGEAHMLARMLEKRFGPLTEEQLERIRSADEDTLWAWSDHVFQADSADQV
ncbi:DUF4351 domain-containing protein, partial [Halorhodospira sp. 9622]|uniref:DUF4351 domain-containing protein n=1 Tax=Halorhodospira sp. 9622 TaxID=2899136 RepID=UPI001EE8A88F